MLIPGTVEHVNFCTYKVETSRNPATRNYWQRKAEESEYLLYVNTVHAEGRREKSRR